MKLLLKPISALFLAACLGFPSLPAPGCSIPVYRYALERWEPEVYEITVFQRGEILSGQKQLILELNRSSWTQEKHFNFSLNIADWDEAQGRDASHYELDSPPPEFPWVAVRHVATGRPRGVLLSGPLREEWIQSVIDSPARQTIARRLIEGESAVWLFLESGNREKDENALSVLSSQLDHLEKTLRLPDPNTPPLFEKDSTEEETILVDDFSDVDTTGLRIDFSILRLSRDDPAEKMLIEILLRSEMDLVDYEQEPMAFPVFGQGRILYALVGGGIEPETIREACEFIVGPCSCQVKALNPGTDLLMRAEWTTSLETLMVRDKPIPLPFGLPPLTAHDLIQPATHTAEAAHPGLIEPYNPISRNLGIVMGLLVLVNLAAAAFWMKRRAADQA
ncbi:MAG: hypothetical protein ACE15F_10410 [bacterium]